MALVFPRLLCNFIVTGTAGNWSRVARVSGLSVKNASLNYIDMCYECLERCLETGNEGHVGIGTFCVGGNILSTVC